MHVEDLSRSPEQLLEAYRPLILRAVQRWGSRYPDLWDDFLSDSFLQVWRGIRRWKPDHCSFASHVHRSVKWACQGRLTAEAKRRRLPMVIPAVVDDEAGGVEELAVIEPPDLDAKLDAAEILEDMPADVASNFRRRFWEGETFEAIGGDLSVTGAAVRDRVKNWVGRLKV